MLKKNQIIVIIIYRDETLQRCNESYMCVDGMCVYVCIVNMYDT